MEKELIFAEAFKIVKEEELIKALSKDAQKNFEYFVEQKAQDYAYDEHFSGDNFCSSLEDRLISDFSEITPDVDEMENGFDYLFDILLETIGDENQADNFLDDFSIFVAKQICDKYENLADFYHDYGEYSITPSLTSFIDEERATMVDWENESKEFHMNYGKEI